MCSCMLQTELNLALGVPGIKGAWLDRYKKVELMRRMHTPPAGGRPYEAASTRGTGGGIKGGRPVSGSGETVHIQFIKKSPR